MSTTAEEQPKAATGAVIEIIERRRPNGDTTFPDVIAPDEIRINGQPLLSPADCPVKVHEIDVEDRSLVCVTLTLIARRVVIAAEDDLHA